MQIVMDITSLARWTGPPVGIIRVERELARWLRRNVPSAQFAFFDPMRGTFRRVRDDILDVILGGESVVIWDAPRAGKSRGRVMLDRGLRLLRFRRNAMLALEWLRLNAAGRGAGPAIESLQERLMKPGDRLALFDKSGQRLRLVPYRQIVGPDIAFGPQTRLVCAGSGWTHHDIAALERITKAGGRLSVLCYDLIPILFPHWYSTADVAGFTRYFDFMFRHADRIVFTARRIRQDALEWHGEPSEAVRTADILPLGASRPRQDAPAASLPDGLSAGRFALFVSTIEPRKGHALLCKAWRRLLDAGIPQQHGFKLVFVGRRGWMVDDTLADIEALRATGTLLHLEGVDDAGLSRLYEDAAFCLYPSAYEGYGLPVIEAYLRGKPVIAGDGGSLPEVVGDFSPSLSIGDPDAWEAMIASWIADPGRPAALAERLREHYAHPDWDAASAGIVSALIRD